MVDAISIIDTSVQLITIPFRTVVRWFIVNLDTNGKMPLAEILEKVNEVEFITDVSCCQGQLMSMLTLAGLQHTPMSFQKEIMLLHLNINHIQHWLHCYSIKIFNIIYTLYISTVVQQQNAVIAKGYDYHDVKFELSLVNP